jgi:hypothetical protein
VSSRDLTAGEWQSLSPGLVSALQAAGARPRLKSAAHPAARIAGLLRRTPPPVLTRGDMIFWPSTPADISSAQRLADMATLQHELQHVLDYKIGWLTAATYLSHPRHWSYDWRLEDATSWDRLGAEQRASIAEELWLMEHGRRPTCDLAALREVIPWARSGAEAERRTGAGG